MNERKARLCRVRRAEATKRLLDRLENPPNLGALKGRLTRKEIYEDIS